MSQLAKFLETVLTPPSTSTSSPQSPRSDFEVRLPTRHFSEEDFHFDLDPEKRSLRVTAKSERSCGDLKTTRELNKVIDIPEGFEPAAWSRVFNDFGQLVIRVPKIVEAQTQKENEQPKNKNEDEFSVTVDVTGFAPEDLNVELTADSRVLTVRGVSNSGSSNEKFLEQKFDFPENCEAEEIRTKLSPKNGTLKISAPKKAHLIEEEERPKMVPINVD